VGEKGGFQASMYALLNLLNALVPHPTPLPLTFRPLVAYYCVTKLQLLQVLSNQFDSCSVLSMSN
jgi:hypothetical protein